MEKTARQHMIENITMLWTLNEVPEPPKENPTNFRVVDTRQLTLARERQLVDNLAFISGSTDDMLRVMAVCVEEDPDGQGMTIRLAANTGDLSQTVQNFGSIARTLERAASRVDPRVSIRRDLLRQILVLDEGRILSRLRSRHAARTRKTAGKPALIDLLTKSLMDTSIRSGKITKANLKELRSQSKGLSKTFANFEENYNNDARHDVSLDALADLLRQAFEFDTKALLIALHTGAALDPSVKKYLPTAINKLGRYYSIANDLIDAARSSRYTIFQHVSIKALEEPSIDKSSCKNGLLGFQAVLKRNLGSSYQQRFLQRYSQALNAASTKFQSRLSSRVTPWKIHAEIQLLFFYEQNPRIPHPRTICSSKDACYLCDLFIRLHGKFYIPRTHGRLYDKWILPEWLPDQPKPSPSLLSAIDQFNASLKATIVQNLYNRHAHPQPDESRLQLREPWTSTSTIARVATPQIELVLLDNTTGGVLKEPRASPGSASQVTNTNDTKLITSFALESTPPTKQSIDIDNAAKGPHDEIKFPTYMPSTKVKSLSRGDKIACELRHPASTLIVSTEAIDLYISWDRDPIQSSLSTGDSQIPQWIEAEWLAPVDATGAAHNDDDGNDVNYIDVEKMVSGIDQTIENVETSSPKLKPLAITKGEHTVILRWHS